MPRLLTRCGGRDHAPCASLGRLLACSTTPSRSRRRARALLLARFHFLCLACFCLLALACLCFARARLACDSFLRPTTYSHRTHHRTMQPCPPVPSTSLLPPPSPRDPHARPMARPHIPPASSIAARLRRAHAPHSRAPVHTVLTHSRSRAHVHTVLTRPVHAVLTRPRSGRAQAPTPAAARRHPL